MNAEEMEKLRKIRETEPGGLGLQRSDSRNSHMSKTTTAGSSSIIEDFPDDDLKTPTVEELSFPGQKVSLTFSYFLLLLCTFFSIRCIWWLHPRYHDMVGIFCTSFIKFQVGSNFPKSNSEIR